MSSQSCCNKSIYSRNCLARFFEIHGVLKSFKNSIILIICMPCVLNTIAKIEMFTSLFTNYLVTMAHIFTYFDSLDNTQRLSTRVSYRPTATLEGGGRVTFSLSPLSTSNFKVHIIGTSLINFPQIKLMSIFSNIWFLHKLVFKNHISFLKNILCHSEVPKLVIHIQNDCTSTIQRMAHHS